MKKITIAFSLMLSIFMSGVASHAASLTFVPAGSMLDTDPIRDIGMTPGEQISFEVRIDTTGLENFQRLVKFSYIIDYDGSELKSAGGAFDIERMFPVVGAPPPFQAAALFPTPARTYSH